MMKCYNIRISVFVFLSLWLTNSLLRGQSTYYYQQEKLIDLRTKQHSPGCHHKAGLFLTFNEKGCYDSDRNGYDVGNGFREKVGQSNGLTFYKGNSYWGNNAKYTVNADKSRINVEVSDIVYVYVRSQIPQGVKTSSLIKVKSSGAAGNISPVSPNSIMPNDVMQSNNGNAAYYQVRYNQMEQSLKRDIKTFEQTMSGSYDSSRAMMANSIRQAQQNMADWRALAAKNGVQLSKSAWESVQISIGTIHYEKY